MTVLNAILLIVFNGNELENILMSVGVWLGYWFLFKKSGVKSWWALCPWAREYMLARCAGREPEGRVTSVTAFLMTVCLIALDFVKNDAASLILSLCVMIAIFTRLIYEIRIYNGLTEVYGVRKWWILPWIFLDFVVAPIWGLSKKFQPEWKAEEIQRASLETIQGHYVEGMKDGLTVNLDERTATEFFQKKYLLYDIHMYIKPGHMVLLLGGSGAGKTTFLNAVNGYEKAKAKVTLNGGNIYSEYKKMQYEVGFVPQQELMRGKDTVYHTLMDASLLRVPLGVSRAQRKARVEEVMKIFGLEPVKNNLVEKLSGGQKKRASIAMEFISNPSLFILDEPDSGLDGVMARELMEQLRTIANQGKIVIVITHTPDRVIDLFDDVIVLAKDKNRTGRLAFFGPIEEARAFFGKEKMEEVVMTINRKEEGGEGRADEFIEKYAEVQNG